MMDQMWKWRVQLRLELGLLLRNPVLLLMPLAFSLWFLYSLTSIHQEESRDLYLYAQEFHQFQQMLSLGVAMMAGIVMMRRDVLRSSYEWMSSHPVSSSVWVTAKFVAANLYMSLFTIGAVLVYGVQGVVRDVPGSTQQEHILQMAVGYTWSYGVTIALAMLLAAAIQNVVVYLIGFCAWMFGTIFMEQFLITRNHWFFLKTFHLSQFFLDLPPVPNEVWAGPIQGAEMLYSRVFVGGFILLLIMITITVLKRRRPSQTSRRWISVSLVWGLVTLALLQPYMLLYQDRYAAYQQRLETAPWEPTINWWTAREQREQRYPVEAYEIRLTPKGSNGIRASVEMRFQEPRPNNTEPLYVTVNRDFTITKVIFNGGEPLWERKGDWIEITSDSEAAQHTNQGTHLLQLEYEGVPKGWQPAASNREARTYFVEGHSLFLPDHMAWYPLPGRQELYFVQGFDHPVLTDTRVSGLTGPTRMKVTVDGFGTRIHSTLAASSLESGQAAGSQSFYDNRAEGVTLVAGRFTEVREPMSDTVLVTGPSNRLEGQEYMQAYEEILQYFRSWIESPIEGLHTIFYFPLDEVSVYNLFELELVRDGAYFISQNRHRNLDHFQLSDGVHAALFGDRSFEQIFSDEEVAGNRGVSVISEIRHAFYMVYYSENPMPGIDGTRKKDDAPLYPRFRYQGQGDERIKLQVAEALKDGKQELVKRVLNHYYARGLRVEGIYGAAYPVITYEDWQNTWTKAQQELGNN